MRANVRLSILFLWASSKSTLVFCQRLECAPWSHFFLPTGIDKPPISEEPRRITLGFHPASNNCLLVKFKSITQKCEASTTPSHHFQSSKGGFEDRISCCSIVLWVLVASVDMPASKASCRFIEIYMRIVSYDCDTSPPFLGWLVQMYQLSAADEHKRVSTKSSPIFEFFCAYALASPFTGS